MQNSLRQFGDRAKPYLPGTDVGLAIGVIALLAVLVVPLPATLLDFGLALSVTASILVLMVAVFLSRPLDFTSFPTLLIADDAAPPVAERRDDTAYP